MQKNLLLAGSLVVLAGLGIGIIVLLPWLQQEDKPPVAPSKSIPIAKLPNKVEPKPKDTLPIPVRKESPPAEKKSEQKKIEPKIDDGAKKIEDKKKPPIQGEPDPKKVEVKIEPKEKKVEVKVEPKTPAAKIIAFGDDLIKLNDPDGEYTVKTLSRGLKLKLIGSIKTLTITGANEASLLDATDLVADEVILTGNVNGGSTIVLGKARAIKIRDVNNRSTIDASRAEARDIVLAGNVNSASTLKLSAPKGSIEFAGELNDRADIGIDAPDGKVLFKGGAINSDANILILARDVEFAGAINGGNTKIDITLTKDGTLKAQRVRGGVTLLYRKASDADPELRVTLSDIDARAQVRMVPTQKK